MEKEVLFIHGGGEEGYETDSKLETSLKQALGEDYTVHYPRMQADESLPDFGWPQQIGKAISSIEGDIILAAHSLGASMLLKYLSENEVNKHIKCIFLISTPIWSGEEDWVQGLKPEENFADKLPNNLQIFLYHCKDDEVIPFEHLRIYEQKLPKAISREIAYGGHQLNNDLTIVANDIKSCKNQS